MVVIRNREWITWDKKFACGIKLIDEQHKGLVNLVNQMFNHVTGNDEHEKIYFNRVIQVVFDHVKDHFATEEKIMMITNFSGYNQHKKEHDGFELTIVENIRDYEAGRRLTLFSFTTFLKEWVISHIEMKDREYFDYFRSKLSLIEVK